VRHFSLEIALPKSSPTINNVRTVALPVVIVAFCLQVLLFIVCSVFIFLLFIL